MTVFMCRSCFSLPKSENLYKRVRRRNIGIEAVLSLVTAYKHTASIATPGRFELKGENRYKGVRRWGFFKKSRFHCVSRENAPLTYRRLKMTAKSVS